MKQLRKRTFIKCMLGKENQLMSFMSVHVTLGGYTLPVGRLKWRLKMKKTIGEEQKGKVMWLVFTFPRGNACLAVPSPSIPGMSSPKLKKMKREKKLCCGKMQPLNDTSNNLSSVQWHPSGETCSWTAAAPLFDVGWAGYRTCGALLLLASRLATFKLILLFELSRDVVHIISECVRFY